MTNAAPRYTAQINLQWTVGDDVDAVFPMLARTDDACGRTQQSVSGTLEDFWAAHAVCVARHPMSDANGKRNMIRLMREFGHAIRLGLAAA